MPSATASACTRPVRHDQHVDAQGFQISTDGDWPADYPDPSSYLPQFFGCGGGTSNDYFCDPALDRAMREASQLGLTDPARSAAAWAAIDHRLTEHAAWEPTVSCGMSS